MQIIKGLGLQGWGILCFLSSTDLSEASARLGDKDLKLGDDFYETKTVKFNDFSTFVMIEDYDKTTPKPLLWQEIDLSESSSAESELSQTSLPLTASHLSDPQPPQTSSLTLSAMLREGEKFLLETRRFIEEELTSFIEQRDESDEVEKITEEIKQHIQAGSLSVEDIDTIESQTSLEHSMSEISLSPPKRESVQTQLMRYSAWNFRFWPKISSLLREPTVMAACAAYLALMPLGQKDLLRLQIYVLKNQVGQTRNFY